MNAPPQIIPHIKLIPHNSFFQILDRDVLRTLKFGRQVSSRFFVDCGLPWNQSSQSHLFFDFILFNVAWQGEAAEADPDFIAYNSRVVSRRHAEIWAVNGEVLMPFRQHLWLCVFSPDSFPLVLH